MWVNKMKKILLLIIILSVFLLNGCKKDNIDHIEVKEKDIVCCIDIFNITDYHLNVYDKNGNVTEVQITHDMVQNPNYDIGDIEIIIKYKNKETIFKATLEPLKVIKVECDPDYISCKLADFEYSDIQLNIYYNDNTMSNDVFSRDLLTNDKIILLGKTGTHKIDFEYMDCQANVTVNLKPNDKDISELTKDAIVYTITEAKDDKYISKFYLRGEKVSGTQFRFKVSKDVTEISFINKINNLQYHIEEGEYSIIYVNGKNITEDVELFNIEFSSSKQYSNFTLDYSYDNMIVGIDDTNVIVIDNTLFTFTR